MIVIFLGMFSFFGYTASCVIKRKSTLAENLVLGFFTYFFLFQLAALPLILLKQSLTLLIAIWLGVVTIVGILSCIVLLYRNIRKKTNRSRNKIQKKHIFCYLAMGAVVLFFCYFTAIQNYWGWDTAFYIGTISTTVDTNTMYLINGENGMAETVLPLRYALSGFYMNSAVFCKITGIEAIIFQKYVMGTLCVLLYFCVMYLLGQALFDNKLAQTTGFIWVAGMINLFFISEYTTSQFLLLRAYEAKAYCGNVVLPACIWMLVMLHKNLEERANWKAMFLILSASVAVSMSSILIVPAMFVIAWLAEMIAAKNKKIIVCGILCLIPNIVYLVMYLLHTLGIFVIKV